MGTVIFIFIAFFAIGGCAGIAISRDIKGHFRQNRENLKTLADAERERQRNSENVK